MSQPLEALAVANEVRYAQAEIKRQLRDGELTVGEALDRKCMQNKRVFDVLCAQWRWGPEKAANELARKGIGLYKRVGDLTDRQRELFA